MSRFVCTVADAVLKYSRLNFVPPDRSRLSPLPYLTSTTSSSLVDTTSCPVVNAIASAPRL